MNLKGLPKYLRCSSYKLNRVSPHIRLADLPIVKIAHSRQNGHINSFLQAITKLPKLLYPLLKKSNLHRLNQLRIKKVSN